MFFLPLRGVSVCSFALFGLGEKSFFVCECLLSSFVLEFNCTFQTSYTKKKKSFRKQGIIICFCLFCWPDFISLYYSLLTFTYILN